MLYEVITSAYKVKRLPLIIVYRSGEETGRLQGKVSEPMEKVLFDILKKSKWNYVRQKKSLEPIFLISEIRAYPSYNFV